MAALDTHGPCWGLVPGAWDLAGDDQFLFLTSFLPWLLAARALTLGYPVGKDLTVIVQGW